MFQHHTTSTTSTANTNCMDLAIKNTPSPHPKGDPEASLINSCNFEYNLETLDVELRFFFGVPVFFKTRIFMFIVQKTKVQRPSDQMNHTWPLCF